jgi:hypothetical protein
MSARGFLAALLLTASLAGCSGYLDHNDTVSASAGDAVAANAAIQTVDPWPRAAEDTEILSGGKEIKNAAPPVAPPPAAPGAAVGGDAAAGN